MNCMLFSMRECKAANYSTLDTGVWLSPSLRCSDEDTGEELLMARIKKMLQRALWQTSFPTREGYQYSKLLFQTATEKLHLKLSLQVIMFGNEESHALYRHPRNCAIHQGLWVKRCGPDYIIIGVTTVTTKKVHLLNPILSRITI